MNNIIAVEPAKGLALTFLVRLSIASPSGGRSEIENLNIIKKIREGYLDFPYSASQAMKRALRETLKGLGYPISPIVTSKPSRTACEPKQYIDDDLFGFMDASSKKADDKDEDSDDVSKIQESDPILTKEIADKITISNPIKKKIDEYFTQNPGKENITYSELKGILDKNEQAKLIKAITKDEQASFQAMLKNLNGVRKSIISMTPLISMTAFNDNIDFGANMMGLKGGVNPMPYETEIHRGWYRISLYVDLDRIGTGDGFVKNLTKVGEEKSTIRELLSQKDYAFDFIHQKSKTNFVFVKKEYDAIDDKKKYERAKALLDAIRFLAPSGRNSNWLMDLTPKLMVAAYVKGAKTPFLETPLLKTDQLEKDTIDLESINIAKNLFKDGFVSNGSNEGCLIVGHRADLIGLPNDEAKDQADSKNVNEKIEVTDMKSAFDKIDGWLKTHFKIKDSHQGDQ